MILNVPTETMNSLETQPPNFTALAVHTLEHNTLETLGILVKVYKKL